ncbi:bifunctional DNA-formamidopyrimidine glycosylase/DNA-(apurinic or apyrimidinic site) lyase [Myxococcus sp. K38C18041901]|uniref:bifunctional DNA-formamidopyrimidine glycosylase/DNA-(apurinic or apyrimidinic site) lyase n=1 Tax=Myxococcus guangdongensis TaxID=2906760 RepID=UPI0020A78995|nr:bifunctional DNA-formamidopyrimidine glycosylase/DNA-(apurinic or apyrimidinic site) lyase [Myxococcus guangdongensis]MCP3057434.1 bifunctional DNA-formamidopyrimidine glycosylase/DNA-(apurinic or apyrimidinic site) lyase [Myxococcus guangdongensis]
MAEVPEVEIITRDLRQAVVGRRIADVEVLVPAAVRFPSPEDFVTALRGRRIVEARRRAKFILLGLDAGQTLALHFMLWGELSLRPAGGDRPSETLVILTLEDGEALYLTDTLGYARVAVGPTAELSARLKLEELGPEVLDTAFTPEVLARRLGRRRSPLKTVLLNQRIIAGLGNRDADESLWRAGLDPRRLVTSLSRDEVSRLHQAMRTVLEEGLALRGTQRDLFGVKGQAKHRRNVFERTGAPCPACDTPITHERVGGRNTHWCPRCQPEEGAATAPTQGVLW